MVVDHYAPLGVARNATGAEFQAAHRTLVKQYHPDKYPDDYTADERDAALRRFHAVREAYEVLTKNRAAYDAQLRRAEYDEVLAAQARTAERDRRRTQAELADLLRRATANTWHQAQPGPDARVVFRVSNWFRPEPLRIVNSSDGSFVDLGLVHGGYSYRFPGLGFPGPTGLRGDLFVDVEVVLPQRGADLFERLHLTAADARDGGVFRSPVDGAPLQFGSPVAPGRYRFPGQGEYGSFGGPPGDLIVDVEVERAGLGQRVGWAASAAVAAVVRGVAAVLTAVFWVVVAIAAVVLISVLIDLAQDRW
jgi:DnaJ-class molecular chaperone